MFAQIGSFLIESLFGFFVFLALLRFFMQSQRVSFRNPIGQLVISLTNWAVLPLRRIFPGMGGFDWASLAVAWLTLLAEVFLLHMLFGTSIALSTLPTGRYFRVRQIGTQGGWWSVHNLRAWGTAATTCASAPG